MDRNPHRFYYFPRLDRVGGARPAGSAVHTATVPCAQRRTCVPAGVRWSGLSTISRREPKTTCSVPTFRPCSFVSDWWAGTIPSRIASLIYINFDEPERLRAQSDVNEQGLRLCSVRLGIFPDRYHAQVSPRQKKKTRKAGRLKPSSE
jgi:hypothetical protein